MYQKGVGYLVGYLAIYPRPSTKTASWTENWITDITESNSWYLILEREINREGQWYS